MNEFIVSWHASGYNCTFNYLVVADTLDTAKEKWYEFLVSNEDLSYTWNQARKGDVYHTGGYTKWTENGPSEKEPGCYDMPINILSSETDHVRD